MAYGQVVGFCFNFLHRWEIWRMFSMEVALAHRPVFHSAWGAVRTVLRCRCLKPALSTVIRRHKRRCLKRHQRFTVCPQHLYRGAKPGQSLIASRVRNVGYGSSFATLCGNTASCSSSDLGVPVGLAFEGCRHYKPHHDAFPDYHDGVLGH